MSPYFLTPTATCVSARRDSTDLARWPGQSGHRSGHPKTLQHQQRPRQRARSEDRASTARRHPALAVACMHALWAMLPPVCRPPLGQSRCHSSMHGSRKPGSSDGSQLHQSKRPEETESCPCHTRASEWSRCSTGLHGRDWHDLLRVAAHKNRKDQGSCTAR